MRIIVKTLKGTRFEIQVKPEDSVASVKKNVETVLGATAYPAAWQMLIHKGKVLKDETTMQENNVSETSCIAIMMAKTKHASAASKAQRIPEQTVVPPLVQTQQLATPIAAQTCDPMSLFYFDEGIPNNGFLDFLRHTYAYRALRPVVRSNPASLEGLLKLMKKENPAFFRMIQENKAEFLSFVYGEPLEEGAGGNQMGQPHELQDHQASVLRVLNNEPIEEGEGWNQMEKPEEIVLEVTPEEHESILRLEAMGFERDVVVNVFFACDKNENLAANYLLDHSHEFQP